MSLITVLLIVSMCLFLFKLLSPNLKLIYYANKIPGPKAYPIVGNGLHFLTKKPYLQILNELSTTYGSIYRLWFGKKLVIVLSDPDDMEVGIQFDNFILKFDNIIQECNMYTDHYLVFLSSTTKHLDKSNQLSFLDSWLGNTNLLTSTGDIWQVHRKLLTPSFHFKILENSVDLIARNADILVDQLKNLVDRTDFDIEAYLEKFSLDVICEMAMGTRLETLLSKNTDYLHCVRTITELLIKRIMLPWLHPEFIFRNSREGRLYYKNLQRIKIEGQKIINTRKQILDELLQTSEQEERKSTQSFLDFLLTRSGFTDAEIENEVQTLLFAGYDTIKATLSFCLYELSQNEDIQNKLLEEIKSTFIEKNGYLTYQDYNNMKYLECVIKETLRLYTAISMISRKVSEDVHLPSGYILPEGSLVNLFIFHMHRNEHLYPNSKKFLPERFENRNSNRNPFAYLPFSAGPRNCIGQKFAMMEMKIVISTLLLKYAFLPAVKSDPLVLEFNLVICSLNRLPVRIRRRNLEII